MNEWKNQEGQIVKKERYQWQARFKDGSILRQFDTEGIYHRFSEAVRDDLDKVLVFDTEKSSKIPRFIMIVRSGMKPFFIYREIKEIEMGKKKDGNPDFNDVKKETITRFAVVGWTDDRKGVSLYNYLLNDGANIVSSGEYSF